MVDTVRFTQDYVLKIPLPFSWRKRWKSNSTDYLRANGYKIKSKNFYHIKSGLSIRFHKKNKASIQVSLPRVLFGHNAKLITSRLELRSALKEVEKILSDIAKPVSLSKRFSRVDLAWQVRGRIRNFILAHQNLLHPEIRRSAWVWQGESILWSGKEMSIFFYDKSFLVKNIPGEFVRIEIRLRGQKLRNELSLGWPLTHFFFKPCYKVFREKMLMFSPEPLPQVSDKLTKDEILRLSLDEKWMVNKQPAFDFLVKDYSEDRRKQKHRMTSRLRLKKYHIEWEKELPKKPNRVFKQTHSDFSIRPFPLKFYRTIEKIEETLAKD